MIMASKEKHVFVCSQCGKSSPRWMGRCPECGAWDSFEEEVQVKTRPSARKGPGPQPVLSLDMVEAGGKAARLVTGIGEFDRVTGGGIFPKSIILLSGGPGIGKSTLTLQVCHGLQEKGGLVLYFSAEESSIQIRDRAERLGIRRDILLSNEERLEEILAMIVSQETDLIVIDSIQTVYDTALDAVPGTVSQIRNAMFRLREAAQRHGKTILVIGHVTKSGNVAGPMFMEHMVDVVLLLEGDDKNFWRILRAKKNRYGSTQEIGVFTMEKEGLREVLNPSSFFIEESPFLSGSVMGSVMEGIRPIFLEIQALTSRSVYAMPQRVANGIDTRMMNIILAVLEKRLNFHMGQQDVFLNIVGGFRAQEPSVGLAVAMAILSTLKNRELDRRDLFMGEVGLSGEIRNIPFLERRMEEAAKLGFKRAFVPGAAENLKKKGLEIIPCATIHEAAGKAFP